MLMVYHYFNSCFFFYPLCGDGHTVGVRGRPNIQWKDSVSVPEIVDVECRSQGDTSRGRHDVASLV